jgi:hypothetical protein
MSQFPYHPERFLEWTILPDFMFETSEQWVKVLNAKTNLRSTPQTSQAQTVDFYSLPDWDSKTEATDNTLKVPLLSVSAKTKTNL